MAEIQHIDGYTFNDTVARQRITDLQNSLGDLATANSVSAVYTPQGIISTPTINAGQTKENISQCTNVGTLSSLTYDASTQTLIFNAGTLPTIANKQVVTNVAPTVQAGTLNFTGQQATITSD